MSNLTSAGSGSTGHPHTKKLESAKGLKHLAAFSVVGFGAGAAGVCLALMLHFIQHIAFGYSQNALISHESFLQGVTAASSLRRFVIVSACGLIAGLGWTALFRWGRPLVHVSQAIASENLRMPVLSTISNAVLQVITVAMGSPLGREVAPREIGSLVASYTARYAGMATEDYRVIVACGSAAGLAAVYNVPIAASIFAAEVLLRTARPTVLLKALFTCAVAASVAKLGLGSDPQYHAADFPITSHLLLWCAIFGPVFGGLGMAFKRLTQHAQGKSPLGAKMFIACVLSFPLLGLLSVCFPELLGNGKGPAQLAFDGHISRDWGVAIICLKLTVVVLALLSGAKGGLMTPGIAIGALVASILGTAWSGSSPLATTAPYAIVGAAAFLSSSMAMPLTAVALLVEFMHLPLSCLAPLGLAVGGATLCRVALQHAANARIQRAALVGSGSHVVRLGAMDGLFSAPLTRTTWKRTS